jgi:molecular chaperone HscB
VTSTAHHFQLFGLPLGYALDPELLQRRYRELQRTVHPDRFANQGSAERLLAVREAARINEAYQTLRDPVRRARYLLELQGGHWQEAQTLSDTAFLLEQMELREVLEAAIATGAAESLERLCREVTALEQAQEQRLAAAFADLAALQLDAGKGAIQKLMFFRKLRAEADSALNTLYDRQ